MRELRSWSFAIMVFWISGLAFALGLGLQLARGNPLPACANCHCKEVQDEGDQDTLTGTWVSYGTVYYDTNDPIASAIEDILAAGGCGAGTPDLQDTDVDVVLYQTAIITCTGAPVNNWQEVNVTDLGTVYDTAGLYKCYTTE